MSYTEAIIKGNQYFFSFEFCRIAYQLCVNMIVLLSPAKSLDFKPAQVTTHTLPRFLKQSQELVKVMRQHSAAELRQLMDISAAIADLNVQRYKQFSFPFTSQNSKAAILAFKGDVYQGLQVEDLNEQDLAFAQRHVRILSGLYGLLRPMDLIQPYRLEMGTKLRFKSYDDLYDYWGDQLTQTINHDLAEVKGKIILNLASQEYFAAVKPALLQGRLITIKFLELRDDEYKFISFNAKKARGIMCRYIIRNRISKAEDLYAFREKGYRHHPELSSEDEWVFVK